MQSLARRFEDGKIALSPPTLTLTARYLCRANSATKGTRNRRTLDVRNGIQNDTAKVIVLTLRGVCIQFYCAGHCNPEQVHLLSTVESGS